MSSLDPVLKAELNIAYDAALAQGLWSGTVLENSQDAYFNILAKIFFDPGQRVEAGAAGILNRADLQIFDPLGFAVVDQVFRGALWPGSTDGTATLSLSDAQTGPDVPNPAKPPDGKPAVDKGKIGLDTLPKTDLDKLPDPRVDTADGLKGSEKAGKIMGKDTDDFLVGFAGDDLMSGGQGKDVMDGGDGKDIALADAAKKDVTVVLQKDAAIVVSDRTGDQGEDALINFETLQFAGGETLDLEGLQNTLTLNEADVMRLVELYVAYFDRAPDAEGLYFWADCLADGMTMPEIAAHFFDQPETQAKYAGEAPAALVAQVYQNCLGRVPDAAGMRFWTSKLEIGEVPPEGFILAVIEGAKADTGSAVDADYFAGKVNIGAYFAIHQGMTDAATAQAAMTGYDGSQGSLLQAKVLIDNAYDQASSGQEGTLLIQLIGLIDDPLAGL